MICRPNSYSDELRSLLISAGLSAPPNPGSTDMLVILNGFESPKAWTIGGATHNTAQHIPPEMVTDK